MYLSKRFLNIDSETYKLQLCPSNNFFKTEKVIGRTESSEQYNLNLSKQIDIINCSTKDDQPTTGVFLWVESGDNIGANTRSTSRRYKGRAVKFFRQFLTTEISLKLMKNNYFMLKALFVFKIFKFLSWLFDYVKKRLDLKAKVNFEIYDVTGWTKNIYNVVIAQHLKK